MTILADTSIANHALVLSTTERISDDDLIDRIQRELTAGTAHYILAGRDFIELKDRLRGRFIEVVELKFDMSIDVIEIWMNIARAFPDPAKWQFLPSAYTTLNILTRIPQETRDLWIDEEKINRRTTGARAKELVDEALAMIDHDNDDNDLGGDHDDDRGDNGGDGRRDDDDHSGPCTDDVQTTSQTDNSDRNDIGADSNAELERLKAHIEELEAYIEQLEAQAGYSENKTEALQRQVEELKAVTGLGDVGWNQRQLLTRAIEAAQKAIQSKDDSKERLSLQKDAGTYIIELVRSARRDGLDVERFDLAYRPRPEEKLTKGEKSSAPLGAEAQLQAAG